MWLVALGLAALVVVPVVSLVVMHGWPGVYGQDAFWYQQYAEDVRAAWAGGRLPGPFTWPPGFPVLAAAVSAATGPGTMAAQAVSLAAGGAVAALTWLLARELRPWTRWSGWSAIAAGLIAGVTPHLWQSAAVVMSDTTGLAAMTLGAWSVTRWAGGGRLRWAVLGAMATAFAVDTRQVYALAAVALAVAAVIVAVRRAGTLAPEDRARFLAVTLGLPLAAAILVLAPMLGPMAWAWGRGAPVPFATQLTSHPWSPANAVRSETTGPDGTQRWPLPMGLFAVTEPFRPYHLGPVFAVAAAGGAFRLMRRARASLPLAVLVAWPALVLLELAGDVVQNTRFALAVLPPLAILASGGLDAVAAWVGAHGRPRDRRRAVTVGGTLVLGGLLLVNAVGAWHFTDSFIGRFQASSAALARLVESVPADGRLVALGATLELRWKGRDVTELSALPVADATALARDGRPTWIVLPAGVIDTQWAGTPIAAAFVALGSGNDAGPRLEARDGPWELWRTRQEASAAP